MPPDAVPTSTLTILGATGYTGRLCAAAAVERGVPVRLAGRRTEALDALAAELRSGATAAVSTVVADVGDRRSLSALAGSSEVLLTTVGPYGRLGRPVAEAALAGGCAYVDVSGEVGFLSWAHGLRARAEVAGVALCPGAGFDGAPGEALAVLAAERMGGPVRRVRVAYRVRGGAASAGTLRSALGAVGDGGRALLRGRVVPEPVFVDRWRAPFPDGPADALSVPLPEVVTLARSTGTRDARTYAVLRGAGGLARAAAPVSTVAQVLGRTPLPRAADALLDRLPGVRGGGPDPGARARAVATVVVEVEGEDLGGGAARVVGTATLTDPYAATARSAVAVAARLRSPAAPLPGVWTPTQAIGGAERLLAAIGADWELAPGLFPL